jgi:DNA modification methylase
MTHSLYYGDNLDIIRQNLADESVDLIYLDPPFNSKRNYNLIYKENTGKRAESQIMAFEDTWHWTQQTEALFDDLGQIAPKHCVELMNSFVMFIGRNDLTAYLIMLTARLVELRRVLKPTGSLFLHCDPMAGSHIKLVLDSIFGPDRMVNQITWQRTGAKGLSKNRLSNNADFIFWYSKGEEFFFQQPYLKYSKQYLKSAYRFVEEGTGRRYRLDNVTNPSKERPNLEYDWRGVKRVWRWTREKMEAMEAAGRLIYSPSGMPNYKRYLDEMEGVAIASVWTDIKPLQGSSREYLGYPTQKPIALLGRIIQMASPPGSTILDPFCGCGTTIEAAQRLDRNWIGIDITYQAIKLIRERLQNAFPNTSYRVLGVPVSFSDAQQLAKQSKREFELWAISQVGARPAQEKAGADGGIDGVMFFRDEKSKRQEKILVQVKGGDNIGVKEVREFHSTLEREKATMGLLITLANPTKPMQTEAAAMGFYQTTVLGVEYRYPKLQILPVETLIDGTSLPQVPFGAGANLKAAPRFQSKPEDYTADMFAAFVDDGDFEDELLDDDFDEADED